MQKKEAPPGADTIAPARNFTLSVDERLRAYTQGVPSHIRRRRRIEDLEERLVAKLAEASSADDPASSRAFAEELALLNDLIARHNRYYPIEANLPIDPKTGRSLERGLPWRPLPPVTRDDLAARAAEHRTARAG